MLVLEERGKSEYPEKTSRCKDENQQQTQPTYDAESGNRARATLVGGECSHHCAIPAPYLPSFTSFTRFTQELQTKRKSKVADVLQGAVQNSRSQDDRSNVFQSGLVPQK